MGQGCETRKHQLINRRKEKPAGASAVGKLSRVPIFIHSCAMLIRYLAANYRGSDERAASCRWSSLAAVRMGERSGVVGIVDLLDSEIARAGATVEARVEERSTIWAVACSRHTLQVWVQTIWVLDIENVAIHTPTNVRTRPTV